MRIQLLSDLHMETEPFDPQPAPDAELLVLAGDIDATWAGLDKFKGWPVPVLFVAGNHEFDGREMTRALPDLRERTARLGFTMLERQTAVIASRQGQRIRFVATTRWCDFDLFGEKQRERAMRAATYFMKVQRSTQHGVSFDAAAVRVEALACKAWLADELEVPKGNWDKTVAITHFAPSLKSADPRYGNQPGTASFCNADDALLPHADVWIHGHLHCRQDYRVGHAAGSTRVVCNARGHVRRREAEGFDAQFTLDVA